MARSEREFVAGFVGRTQQLAVIAAAAEAASSGRPSVVWVEGEAGAGKTALVRQSTKAWPDQFQLLQAQADELASDIPYELVEQLGPVAGEGPFEAGMQLLEAWSRAQDYGPVGVIVEDLHWADTRSSQALLTAVKRLDRDRVVVVITSRPRSDAGWDRFRMDSDRCRQLVLTDLDVDEVAALAASTGIELTHRQAVRLHAHTGGHPLYVRTLLAELCPAQLQEVDRDLPAPRSLASAVTARLSELPGQARDLAAAMSVINQRAPLPTIGRVAGVAAPMEPFEQLLGTGFVRWDRSEPGPPADFAHPLFRLAVYQDLSPTRRRDLHRAAAGVLTPSAVLAHRVAAADGADDGLADELEAAAWREKDVENSALQARNLLWASSLSQTPEQAERRLLAATWALLDSGQTAQAATLRHQLEACRESPTGSLLLGTIDWELGNAVEAERSFRRAAVEGEKAGDRLRAGWAWVRLGELYSTKTRAAEAISAAERALSLAPNEPRIERLAWICLAMGEGMSRGALAGLLRLRERLPQVGEDVPPSEADMLVTRGTLELYAGLTTIAIDDHRAVLRRARWGSVPNQIARCHFQMATLLVNSGEWDEAFVHARTALSIASDERAVWIKAQCHSVLGALAAYRGDSDLATQHVTTAQEIASQRENMEALFTARVATAAVGRAQGQPQQIIDALIELPRLAPMIAALTFWPPLIVALIDAGQLQRAEDQIAGLSRAAASRGLDFEARLAGLRARVAVAQGRPDKATDHFEAALRLFGSDDPFLDRALTHHAYGQLLRATGERQSAVSHLRTANQMLASVGAEPFLTRVDDDLGAAGIHRAGKSRRSTLELTDREHDVALLVAKGLTNPEVAEQLYISRKAVEYHLRNVYGKLGITSRRELRTAQL